MHKNATKYNKTQSKWCINKHGASKIIDTFETYQNTTATITLVDEPSLAQLDSFRIPMKVVERVMNNCYSGDRTVHLGDHLLFIH
jgi:hypothetical protein